MYADYEWNHAEMVSMLECDDFVEGFRVENGCHELGRVEQDPEMYEYEQILDLGLSLGGGIR